MSRPNTNGRDYNLGALQRLYRCALPKEFTNLTPSPNPNPTRALTLKNLFQHRRKHPDFNTMSRPNPNPNPSPSIGATTQILTLAAPLWVFNNNDNVGRQVSDATQSNNLLGMFADTLLIVGISICTAFFAEGVFRKCTCKSQVRHQNFRFLSLLCFASNQKMTLKFSKDLVKIYNKLGGHFFIHFVPND
eukprot:sb/3471136/